MKKYSSLNLLLVSAALLLIPTSCSKELSNRTPMYAEEYGTKGFNPENANDYVVSFEDIESYCKFYSLNEKVQAERGRVEEILPLKFDDV